MKLLVVIESLALLPFTPDEKLIDSFRQKAQSLGYEDLYRGVRVTPGDPNELVESPEKLDAALARAVEESVEKDSAQAVIMGGWSAFSFCA